MNIYLFGSILNQSSLLMVAACGAYIAIKAGHFNLGGEGQVYAGGFTAAVFLSFCGKFAQGSGLPAFISLSLCFLVSGLTASFMALISVLLKRFRQVDVLLTSFLMSAGVIPLIDSLIAGPFRGDGNNLLATAFILKKYRFLQILKPSPLNLSIFVAAGFCVLLFFFVRKNRFGKELCVYGISNSFAVYSGLSSAKADYFSVCLSGFMHGVTGMFAVCGTYFTCHSGFYGGFGWNALSVALIALSNPLLIIPSALVLAALNSVAGQYALLHNFGFDMGSLLQGLILLLIVLASSKTVSNVAGKIFRRQK